MLLKVDRTILPTVSIVLDMKADEKMSIILGRPFLKIGNALIDIQQGRLTLRVNNKYISFNINAATLKQPLDFSNCYSIDAYEDVITDDLDHIVSD